MEKELFDKMRDEKAMTPGEFAETMRKLVENYGHDEEMFHVTADGLMTALLVQLGYEDGVKTFINQPKWYA